MIGVIANTNAKGIATDPHLPQRLAQIGGYSTMVRETHNLHELEDAVREFANRGMEVIAACGGDGTNLSVLTEMINLYGIERLPPFAILQGGTVNTVAANLGIKGSPEDILTRLVACRNRGMKESIETHSLLSVNARYGFIFGGAMAAKFFESYYHGPLVGVGWASVLAVRTILSSLLGTPFSRHLFQSVQAEITVDGMLLDHHCWSLLAASTLMNVGLGFRITYRALEREEFFHLVASGLPPFQLAKQLQNIFLARPLKGTPHFDVLCKEVCFEFEHPVAYIIDGDLFQESRVVVKMGPRIQLSIP